MKRLLLLLAALMPVAAAQARQSAAIPEGARTAWGFDRSDLPPHPGVRFGVLANGMRYAIMRNKVPVGGLSVRLRIGVGASAEGEREQGFLHLVEHMIFHGSETIPEGALPLMLQHQGLRRWSDFDAYTSYDETVFRLDLGKADDGARATALRLMREISGNLVFTRRAVEGAKRKVWKEIAARDALQDRIATAKNAFFMPGSPIARASVAGTKISVKRANAKTLRRLYENYYVPRHATLVVVGDVDPAVVEAEIAMRFSDWRPRGEAVAVREPPAIQADRGTESHLFVDRAAPTEITIAAVAPLGRTTDAGARRDFHFLQHLGSEMLNRRLGRIAAKADAPFASANSAIYDHFSTARLARIEVAAKDRDWRLALGAGALELRRALEQGFSQSELDAQLAASRRGLLQAAAPRANSMLADAIVDAASRGIVFTALGNPSANEDYLARIRLANVNIAFRSAWAQSGRLTFISHHKRIPRAEAAIAAASAEVAQRAPPL